VTYTLGIDLGTTYSAAAVHANGVTEMISLGSRATIMPSAVFVTESGEVLVGEAAVRRGASEPERLCREFKRRIGDSVPIIVGGSPFSAEALTARVLRAITSTVVEQRGGKPERIVVTHPANWGAFKLERLSQAIRIAELVDVVGGDTDKVTTLTEPEAAAISYAVTERVPVDDVIAVYDLGGGTFDASVLRKTQDGFELLGSPEGIERLGGIDVDEAIYSHVLRALGDVMDNLDPDDPGVAQAAARLRNDCVEAKEALSSDTQASIPVLLPNLHTEVRLTRGELETMVRPFLEDTIGALRRAITSTGLSTSDIDRVLLVGGSSRIPLVAQLVTEALGRPFFVDAHPKHAVALGAALSATDIPAAPPRPAPVPGPVPPSPAPPPVPESSGSMAPARAVPASPAPSEFAPGGALAPLLSGGGPPTAPAPYPGAPGAPVEPPPPPPGPAPEGRSWPLGQMPAPAAPGPPTVRADDPTGPIVHDPTTEQPLPAPPDLPPGTPEAPPMGRGPKPPGDQRRVLAAIGAVAVVAVVAVALVLRGGGGGDDDDSGGSTTSTTEVKLAVAGTTAVDRFPDGMAVEGDKLWVALTTGHSVQTLDLATGAVKDTFPLQGEPLAVASGAESIWVTQRAANKVARFEPNSGQVTASIDVPDQPAFLTFADGFLWVGGGKGTVTKIDPATNEAEIVAEGLGSANGVAVTSADQPIWITTPNGVLVRDLAGGQEDVPITVGTQPDYIVIAPSGVWVANRGDGTLSRIDQDTLQVDKTVTVGGAPTGLAVDGDRIWAITQAEEGPGELIEVDGASGEIVDRVEIGEKPLGVITSPGRVWVSLSKADQVARVESP